MIYDISYKTLTYSKPLYIRFDKTDWSSYDWLLIEQRLTLHNVIILIELVLNKDKYHYYYKMFLEKCSYQLAKK